jgi:hypothetical protein
MIAAFTRMGWVAALRTQAAAGEGTRLDRASLLAFAKANCAVPTIDGLCSTEVC